MEKTKLSILFGFGVAAALTIFEALAMLAAGRDAPGSLTGFMLALILPVAAGSILSGRFNFKAGAEVGIFVVLLSLGTMGYVQLIPNTLVRGLAFFALYGAAFALGSHLLEVPKLTTKRKWVIFSGLFIAVVFLYVGVNFATRLVFSNAS